ncbi:MAG: SusC/RagA family TonB-linked outer membrane protein [Chitinophagaceae bacterium]|nr:SusC/RagA family TonB-linked outer membrane protein [Chitinophagaceae bacterium]
MSVSKGATIDVSYIGFDSKSFVAGAGPVSISLIPGQGNGLNEVVVTALGIKREKKALGYAVASVGKKDLELRPESDVVRILNGKAPGVDILAASGMSGSGTNIIIRGVNTISGSSTPLFIVDGVPFDASTNAQASFVFGNTTSSRFLDLDPNNIESIDVLKGLSATTLYGELGRNGVVVVTTKNGSSRRSNKKLEVTVNQSIFWNNVANLPEYQQRYGGGFDQSLGLAFFSNWGAEFTSPAATVPHPYDRTALRTAFPEFVGAQYEYKAYPNTVKNFFRTGLVSTTSVNVGGSSQNASFNVNYTYNDDKGFTPGNSVFKNTFGMGGSAKLANKMTVSGSFNYATTDFKSPPTSTSFGSNPSASSVFGNLIYTPIAINLMGTPADGNNYLPWNNPLDNSSVYYRANNDIQNPRWTVANGFTGQKVNRVFGNISARYDVLKNLAVTYRVGLDRYSDYNFLSQNKGGTVGGAQYQLGMHRTVNGYNTIWNHDLILNYNTDFGQDWRLNVDAGLQSQERIYEQNGMKSTQQLVYGLFNHNNFIVQENRGEDGSRLDFLSRTQSVGVYGQAQLAFREYLYATVGGRNSWSSNLEQANRSLFYPSASVSFIPTSAIAALKDSRVLNYVKLRAGYATSANFGFPYSTRNQLNISTNVFQDRSGTTINTNSIANRLANPDLRPELLSEVEVGVEGRFFNNRFNLDFTWYSRTSKDQILDRDLDPSTGFTVTSINAGSVRNQGIEIGAGYTVIRGKDWRWQVDGNFTLNRSLVSGLPDDIKQIVVDGFSNQGLFAINGQPLGIIQGQATLKDEKTGQRLVDGNGNYIGSQDLSIIGNPIPDFKLTGISTLSWKGLSFRMQWDYTKGGDMLAYTPATLIGRGLTRDTEFDRTLPLILPGVKQDGTPNDIQISTSQAYFNNFSGQFAGTDDLVVYDATVIRLREASLSYSLPEKWIRNTPFGQVSLNFAGQNLWYNAPNFPKYVNFDPETSSLGVSNVRGLEYLSGPTSRRYGFSVRVTF